MHRSGGGDGCVVSWQRLCYIAVAMWHGGGSSHHMQCLVVVVAVASLQRRWSCCVTVVVVVALLQRSGRVQWPHGIAVAWLDGGGGGGRIAVAAVVSRCSSHVAWRWWWPSHGLMVVVAVMSLQRSCHVAVTTWHGGGGGSRVASWWLHSVCSWCGHACSRCGHGVSSSGARSARPPPTTECTATRCVQWQGHGNAVHAVARARRGAREVVHVHLQGTEGVRFCMRENTHLHNQKELVVE